VRDHLCRCKQFKMKMMEHEPSERPDWFVEGTANKKQHCTNTPLSSTTSTSLSSSTQQSIRKYALPKPTKFELERVENCIAMHYYLTGTSFQRVEEKHLLKAFDIVRPGITLPSSRKLAGECLYRCYNTIARRAGKD
jgi:hypothetical protein